MKTSKVKKYKLSWLRDDEGWLLVLEQRQTCRCGACRPWDMIDVSPRDQNISRPEQEASMLKDWRLTPEQVVYAQPEY